jgi:hypothetical protein
LASARKNIGVEHQPERADGKRQRQPQALAHISADLGMAAGTVVMRDHRRERQQDAHAGDKNGGVNAGTDAHGSQIKCRQMPGHHGVDDAAGHHRGLPDQYRPGELQQRVRAAGYCRNRRNRRITSADLPIRCAHVFAAQRARCACN